MSVKAIEYTADYVWATGLNGIGGAVVWTAVTDFLADGLEPGVEDIILTEYMDGAEGQDAVKAAGEFKATGANVPTAGTRTWFRFTDHAGAYKVLGGAVGARISIGHSSVRPLGGGPVYKRVMFSCSGMAAGDLIKTPA